MNWSGWSAFWQMGGYGLYVWGSLSVTLGLMLLELVTVWAGRLAARRAVKEHA